MSHQKLLPAVFYTYALYSQTADKIYIGFSSDVPKRLAAHNDPRNTGWTSRYRPWKIVHAESFGTKAEALKREKQLKTSRGRDFVRTLIAADERFSPSADG